MSVTSSYSNNHDYQEPPDDDAETVEVDFDTCFTRVPIAACLDGSREKIAECDRARGHTLRVTERGIECIRCEARWTEE